MAPSTVKIKKFSLALPIKTFIRFLMVSYALSNVKNFKSMVPDFSFKIYILQVLKDFGALSIV